MSKKRQQHSSKFKSKVAICALKSEKTLKELSVEFGICPKQISKWKTHLLSNVEQIFDSGKEKKESIDRDLISKLYQEIGEQKVQIDWLKKKSGIYD